MDFQTRNYHSKQDLISLGNLIRQVYVQDPCWNSWSFALFDIWAQRKIGDEAIFQKSAWREKMRLVEGEGGALLGAVVFRDPDLVKVLTLPGRQGLMNGMIAWAEAQFCKMGGAGKTLTIEALESNIQLENCLAGRNFTKDLGHYIFREKELQESMPEPINLPQGFQIKHIETASDLRKFLYGVEVIFNFPDDPDVYSILRQAPSFRPELDLVVLSPAGEIAALGSAWFDEGLSLAEFEPVGTLPAFRRMGLASALIAEACSRLRELGCKRVSVMSWSDSPEANRLYEKAGMLPKVKKNYWKKKFLQISPA